MSRFLSLLLFTLLCTCVRAQIPKTYVEEDGDVHLVGPFQAADLQSGPYADWYTTNAALTPEIEAIPAWTNALKDVRVDIFLGTWCGDSRAWVPRFTELWQRLGLDAEQLNFIGLYNDDERYKQGPAWEEVGRQIHRVPTFIFARQGKEIARIVEQPRTDLLTDVAHIALGYPSEPRYPAANYLMELLETTPVDSVNAHLQEHFSAIRRNVGSSSELNTLGYVLSRAGKLDAALIALRLNVNLFRHDPRLAANYAETLQEAGELSAALEWYEKTLILEPEREGIPAIVADLRRQLGKEAEGN